MNVATQKFWSGSDFAFWCLVDKKRTEHFKNVILNVVQPGDIVVDAGAGTGIFTYFFLQAGAFRVYSIENDLNLVRFLTDSKSNSPHFKQVTLINGDAAAIELPEKVDVIICEMISTGLIDELQTTVCDYLKGFLKKDGTFIPSGVSSYVDLVYNETGFLSIN